MRRRIVITTRDAPREPLSPVRRLTLGDRADVWIPQLSGFLVIAAMIVVLVLLWPGRAVHGRISPDFRPGWVTELQAIAPCATSMQYVAYEDDLCAVWLEGEDQHVVLGPLSERDG